MTVGVDTRTNSLIVAAPQQIFEEVQQLVSTLDQATGNSNSTVQVVKLKRGNTQSVQKDLTAIAGEKARTDRSADSTSSGAPRSGGFSPEALMQDDMRRRIEFFNSRDGGSSGGFMGRPGGEMPRPDSGPPGVGAPPSSRSRGGR